MNRRFSFRRGRWAARAFTLIELLLVVVILAILATIVVPRFTGRSPQARKAAAQASISNMKVALNSFEVDCGRYPTSQEGLAALLEQPNGVNGWSGPYLEGGLPKDPWGNPFVYQRPGQHNQNGFDLSSNGADGQPGGGDDIDNWSEN